MALATIALRLGDAVGKLGAVAHDARFAYVVAFLVVSIVGAIATGVALRLHPSAGEVLTADVPVGSSRTTTSAR